MKLFILSLLLLPSLTFACYRKECSLYMEFDVATRKFIVFENGAEASLPNHRFTFERRGSEAARFLRGLDVLADNLVLGNGEREITPYKDDIGENWGINFNGNYFMISAVPNMQKAKNPESGALYIRRLYVKPEISKLLNQLVRKHRQDTYVSIIGID